MLELKLVKNEFTIELSLYDVPRLVRSLESDNMVFEAIYMGQPYTIEILRDEKNDELIIYEDRIIIHMDSFTINDFVQRMKAIRKMGKFYPAELKVCTYNGEKHILYCVAKSIFVDNLEGAEIVSDESDQIDSWIKDLTAEGYEPNPYALDAMMIVGGLHIEGSQSIEKSNGRFYYDLDFKPLDYAGGEFDRMEQHNHSANDVLFPIGGIGFLTFYVGQTGKYYMADECDLYEEADSLESFMQSMACYKNHREKELSNKDVEELVEELENNTEFADIIDCARELVGQKQYKTAIEKVAEFVLERKIVLCDRYIRIIVSNLRRYWDRYHEEYDEKLIFGIEYHDILKGSPYNIMWKYKKHKYVLVNTPTGIGIYYIDGENIEPADGPDSELLYKKVVKKMLAEGNRYYESIEELKRERGLNG